MSDTRESLMDAAIDKARTIWNRTAPCVWWVCDWTGSEDRRDLAALYDALSSSEARRVEAERQRDDYRADALRLFREKHDSIAALSSKLGEAVKALEFYARRYDDKPKWTNWTEVVCDKFSGLVAHFDWPGDEADEPWEVAEKALSSLSSGSEKKDGECVCQTSGQPHGDGFTCDGPPPATKED